MDLNLWESYIGSMICLSSLEAWGAYHTPPELCPRFASIFLQSNSSKLHFSILPHAPQSQHLFYHHPRSSSFPKFFVSSKLLSIRRNPHFLNEKEISLFRYLISYYRVLTPDLPVYMRMIWNFRDMWPIHSVSLSSYIYGTSKPNKLNVLSSRREKCWNAKAGQFNQQLCRGGYLGVVGRGNGGGVEKETHNLKLRLIHYKQVHDKSRG